MEEVGGCHNNIGARWSDKLPVVDLDCGGAESQPTGHDAARVSHCGRRGCQFIFCIIISEDMGGISRKRGVETGQVLADCPSQLFSI